MTSVTQYGKTPIKALKTIVHLTSLCNLESILSRGLLSRAKLDTFKDVADQEIIGKRKKYGLDSYVPFHFFTNNPFDWRVQEDHPENEYVIIRISRAVARNQKFKIIPLHPLSAPPSILEYDEGFNAINWDLMEKRDYQSEDSRQVCLAECLCMDRVDPSFFQAIILKSEKNKRIVENMLAQTQYNPHVNVHEQSFHR